MADQISDNEFIRGVSPSSTGKKPSLNQLIIPKKMPIGNKINRYSFI
jgi:hypothetical protein